MVNVTTSRLERKVLDLHVLGKAVFSCVLCFTYRNVGTCKNLFSFFARAVYFYRLWPFFFQVLS